MYKKWKVFAGILWCIDDVRQLSSKSQVQQLTTSPMKPKRMMNVWMTKTKVSQTADDTSSEGDSMNNGSNGSQTMDVASSDDQSITDVAAS